MRRLLALLVLATAVPLAALLAHHFYASFLDAREDAVEDTRRLAQIGAFEASRFVRDARRMLEALAARDSVRALDPRACDPVFNGFVELHPQFTNLLTADLAGNVICAALPRDRAHATVPRGVWIEEMERTGRFTISKPVRGALTGRWIVALAFPLQGTHGELAGGIVVPIDLEHFRPLGARADLPYGTTIRIIDGEGNAIAGASASSPGRPDPWTGQNVRGTPIIDAVLARGSGSVLAAGSDRVERIHSFMPVPETGWYIYSGVPAETAFAPVYESARRDALAALIIVVLMAAGAWAVARRVSVPARELAQGARTIAHGDWDARLPLRGPLELAEVAGQFNLALDALRKSESRWRDAESRLSDLIGSVGDGIVSVDLRQRIVYFNQAAERIFGRSSRDTIGQPLGNLIPERYAARHGEYLRAFAGSRASNRAMGQYGLIHGLRENGEEFPIEATISQSGSGEERLFTVVLRDVTERRRLEAERERLLRTLEASLNEIYIFEPATLRFQYVNRSALKNLGYDGEAMRAMTPFDLKPEFDARSFRELIAPLERGEAVDRVFRTTHRRADASLYPVEVHLQRVEDGGGYVFLAVIEDITERVQAEETARRQTARLRQLSRRLVASEEHERQRLARELHDRVGQNVSALGMNLGMLREDLPPAVRERSKERLDDCEQLLQDTGGLVRDILSDLRPPGLDELGLLAALQEEARRAARRGGPPVTVRGAELVPRLPGEAELALFRIAQEALLNAGRHAQASAASVTLEADAANAVLTIADDGQGFDSAAPPPVGHLGIVGMGERAAAIGGTLRVESAPGQGTRVIVEVPRARRSGGAK